MLTFLFSIYSYNKAGDINPRFDNGPVTNKQKMDKNDPKSEYATIGPYSTVTGDHKRTYMDLGQRRNDELPYNHLNARREVNGGSYGIARIANDEEGGDKLREKDGRRNDTSAISDNKRAYMYNGQDPDDGKRRPGTERKRYSGDNGRSSADGDNKRYEKIDKQHLHNMGYGLENKKTAYERLRRDRGTGTDTSDTGNNGRAAYDELHGRELPRIPVGDLGDSVNDGYTEPVTAKRDPEDGYLKFY